MYYFIVECVLILYLRRLLGKIHKDKAPLKFLIFIDISFVIVTVWFIMNNLFGGWRWE